jgi:predicted Rossmann-fold nucleotide-binding protein
VINFDALVEEAVIAPEDLELFRYVDSPEEAWDGIRRFYHLEDGSCQLAAD